ncbi:MAG: hypothetical protein Q8O40_03655 [Chloroflexota bacterium]|nr:hypothetical protein [Chloroflexota bacterium]
MLTITEIKEGAMKQVGNVTISMQRTTAGAVLGKLSLGTYAALGTLLYLVFYLGVALPTAVAWLAIEVVRRLTGKKWRNPIWWSR